MSINTLLIFYILDDVDSLRCQVSILVIKRITRKSVGFNYLQESAILLYRRFAYIYSYSLYINLRKLSVFKVRVPEIYRQRAVYLFGYTHYIYYSKRRLFVRCKSLVEYTEHLYFLKLHKFIRWGGVFKYLARRLKKLRRVRQGYFKKYATAASNKTEIAQPSVTLRRIEKSKFLQKHRTDSAAVFAKHVQAFSRTNSIDKITYLKRALCTTGRSIKVPLRIKLTVGCCNEVA